MNDAVRNMLSAYRLESRSDHLHAVREILQSVTLLALWRSKFFESAAFYGGTALRILYGMDRFSEDMDFSLLSADPYFDFARYESGILEEIQAFGFSPKFQLVEKEHDSAIKSAFLKASTKESLLAIGTDEEIVNMLPQNQKIKIKVEIDTDPPPGFSTEMKTVLQPIPFQVKTYSLPDLFAGKMHAALFRKWVSNVKGRDWYDLVWYAAYHPELRLSHLESRMRASDDWSGQVPLTAEKLTEIYHSRIAQLDIGRARQDVEVFLRDPRGTEIWSSEFFLELLDHIQFI